MHSLVFGVQAVYESLKMRPEDFVQIVIAKGRTLRNLDRILTLTKKNQIPLVQKDKEAFLHWIGSRRHHSANHQGIVAEIKQQMYLSLDEVLRQINQTTEPGFLLLLDEIQDPHNLGALIRSAACAATIFSSPILRGTITISKGAMDIGQMIPSLS